MPTFTVGATTPAAGSAAPYFTMNTGASRRAMLREQGIFTTAATSSEVAFGIPGNTPSAFTTVVPQPHDAADAASTALLGTAWTTVPTVPSVFWRKCTLGAAVGAGVIWKVALDEMWVMAKSTWLVWWNNGGATASALDVYIEYQE